LDFLPTENENYNGNFKVYVGFCTRLMAMATDTMLITPLIIAACWLLGAKVHILIVAGTGIFSYIIYFHYRYGATLGKMLLKIKVTNPDGSAIGLKKALLRSSVDIAFAILLAIAFIFAVSDAQPMPCIAKGVLAWAEQVISFYPSWYGLVLSRYLVWVVSDVFFLLMNKRKRALHDFIAGTVVIHKEFSGRGNEAGHLM
jgi:uncharacterized RDD family membrane protein YckC